MSLKDLFEELRDGGYFLNDVIFACDRLISVKSSSVVPSFLNSTRILPFAVEGVSEASESLFYTFNRNSFSATSSVGSWCVDDGW